MTDRRALPTALEVSKDADAVNENAEVTPDFWAQFAADDLLDDVPECMRAAWKTAHPGIPDGLDAYPAEMRGSKTHEIDLTVADVRDFLAFFGPIDPVEYRELSEGLRDETFQINDAVIHGEVDESILNREIEIAFSPQGSKTFPGRWKTWKGPVRDWLTIISEHKEGEKEGNCFLQGAVIKGDRKAQAVPHLDWLILDLDTGESIEALKARLRHLGLFAVVYTTHSHLKPITDVKKDAVVKFCDVAEPTAKDVCSYLINEKRYQPAVLEGAEIEKTEHTEKGVMLFLKHQPMPKFRVMMLLKERFVIADRPGTQKDAIVEWHERYAGASKLLGAFFDRSCVDPSRLFYTPRHPKGATGYSIEVLAGKPLYLDSVERLTAEALREEAMTPFDRAAKEMGAAGAGGSFKTPGLKHWAMKWAKRFEIVDMLSEIAPEDDRGSMASGDGRVFRCPNEATHSDGGNPKDVGFFCINASDIENGGFVAKCHHDSCQDLDRLNMLDLICQEHNLKVEDLKWTYREEGDPVEVTPFPNLADAKQAVYMLQEGDVAGGGLAARRLGMSSDSDISPTLKRDLLLKIDKTLGIGMKALNAELKFGENTQAKSETTPDDLTQMLEGMNDCYAMVDVEGQVLILADATEIGRQPKLRSQQNFRLWTSNVHVAVEQSDGKLTKAPLSKVWMEWSGRRDYLNGLVFEPGWAPDRCEKQGVYNTWKGFPVEGVPGDWSLLRGHLLQNVCEGDTDLFNFAMTWLSHIWQVPERKPGCAFVVRGMRGTGKSKLFDWVRQALGGKGKLAVKIAKATRMTSRFNKLRMHKLLIHEEEALWAGDKEAEGEQKDMITSEDGVVEGKFNEAYEVSDYARLAKVTNERWAAPASTDGDERRFFVLTCGSARRGDTEFFAAIDEQMENGGLEAMVHEFQTFEPEKVGLSWDSLRKPPVTAGLKQQTRAGLRWSDQFFVDLVEDGEIGVWPDTLTLAKKGEPSKILVEGLKGAFHDYMQKHAGMTGAAKEGRKDVFTLNCEKYLLGRRTTTRPHEGGEKAKCWVLPPREELLALHLEKGWIEEEAPEVAGD